MKTNTREQLPPSRIEFIERYYTKEEAEHIKRNLTENELSAIDGTRGLSPDEDYFNLSLVKRIIEGEPELIGDFDSYTPKNQHHYNTLQCGWMQHENELLTWELGRTPTDRELSKDFTKNQNGLRFKIFYCLKYPDRVERK